MGAKIDLSQSPYYSRYDASKNYTKILTVPGRVYQSREVIEQQQIVDEYLGRLGRTVHREGGVVSGCDATVVRSEVGGEELVQVHVSSGRVFFEGKIRDVSEATFTITGTGFEYVFIDVVQSVVTAVMDNSLYDPALGENMGEEGADRLRETTSFVYFTEEAALSAGYYLSDAVVVISDGVIVQNRQDSVIDTILEVLARRTFEESGHYRLKGMNIVYKAAPRTTDNTSDRHKFAVSSGKAYVLGYEVQFDGDVSFYVDDSVDERAVSAESYSATSELNYRLYKPFAKEISRVVYTQNTIETHQKGVNNGVDTLIHPILTVDYLRTGSAGNYVTYTEGVDFSIVEGKISWALSGDEPSPGVQYEISYNYRNTLTEEQGYRLSMPEYLANVGWVVYNYAHTSYTPVTDASLGYVVFRGTGTTVGGTTYSYTPVVGTSIDVDYIYYLSRIDSVYLDRNGQIEVVRGIPDDYDKAERVYLSPGEKLKLGDILLYPFKKYLITMAKNVRVTMEDLHNVVKRVSNLEYNVAITDLDREAESTAEATDLRGILTDGFLGVSKMDLTHPQFGCSINGDEQYLTTPKTNSIRALTASMANSTTYMDWEDVITNPFVEELLVQQLQASTSMRVNPYAVYDKLGLVTLNPAIDRWTEKVKYSTTDRVTNEVWTSWESRVVVNEIDKYTVSRNAKYRRDSGEPAWVFTLNQESTTVEQEYHEQASEFVYSGSTTTIDGVEAIYYVRSREVTVKASNFQESLDNIKCWFDGVLLPLTPVSPTVAGTESGTVKVGSDGKFTAKFTIPADKFKCGSLSVELGRKEGINPTEVYGGATYVAEGTLETYKETFKYVRTLTKGYLTIETQNRFRDYDPVAQIVYIDKDCMLSSVSLYFASKDEVSSLVVQVRNVVNGYPGEEILTQKEVLADDVYISPDASVETKIDFRNPVYCSAGNRIAICVLTDSSAYYIWKATLGENRLGDNSVIGTNPFTGGVLFTSSNAVTWTAHQESDLKFKLYCCKFEHQALLKFNSVSASTVFSGFGLLNSEYVPNNCRVDYSYILGNPAINPIVPLSQYQFIELPEAAGQITLQADLLATDYVSPVIYRKAFQLVLEYNQTSGAYITRNITFDADDKYRSIRVMFDAKVPSGCSLIAYYLADSNNANSWTIISSSPSIVSNPNGYSTYTYHKSLSAPGLANFKFKLQMQTDNKVKRIKIKRLRIILLQSEI